MTDQKQLFLSALSDQLASIAVINRTIAQEREHGTDLGVRQYQHLRKEYLQQLGELMEQMPASMKLDVVEHVS